MKEIIDLPNPDKIPEEDRQKLREEHESLAFDEDHYLADYVEKDVVEPYLSFEADWETLENNDIQFTAEESDILKNYLIKNI